MSVTRKTLCLALLALLVSAPHSLAQSTQSDAGAGPNTTEFSLGPEDQVRVWIWQEPDLSTTVTVRPDGRISLPLIGSVAAAGRSPEVLEEELVEAYRAFLDGPVVVVIVEQINSRSINVFGEVNGQGRYPMLQRLTILDAIALAGGFTDYANMSNVIVIRNDESGVRQFQVDVKKILENQSDILLLQPGDTVYVK